MWGSPWCNLGPDIWTARLASAFDRCVLELHRNRFIHVSASIDFHAFGCSIIHPRVHVVMVAALASLFSTFNPLCLHYCCDSMTALPCRQR